MYKNKDDKRPVRVYADKIHIDIRMDAQKLVRQTDMYMKFELLK